MKKFLHNFLKMEKGIKKTSIVVAFCLIIVWVYLYNTTYYVVIRFNELGPLTKNMIAYYNGFKVGKIVSIEPDNDFKHTLVRVKLIRKILTLPKNTTVYAKMFPNGEFYLQFIYPQSPSLKTIKRGDMLQGVAPHSLEQFMLGQNISGVTDIVSLHVIQALNATEIANMEMKNFFQNTSKVVNENSDGINASVNNTVAMTKSLAEMAENLNQTSKNLNQTSQKINNVFDEKNLKDSTLNIKDSTSNIKETTGNISKATKDIDKTIKKIDDAMSQVKDTAENLNYMTSGLNETLSKRGAGMRIMFGTPVQPKH